MFSTMLRGEEMKIVALAGTNLASSTNLKLIQDVQARFSDQADITTFDLQAVPVFARQPDAKVPAIVKAMTDEIQAADGVVIATPEYDHSAPAVLLNFLEWLAFTCQALKEKPVLIIGASYGRLGTDRAQNHLRQVLSSPTVDANVLSCSFMLGGSLQAFDEQDRLKNESDIAGLTKAFNTLVQFIK